MPWSDVGFDVVAVLTFCWLRWCWTLHKRLTAIEATTKTDPLTGVGSATWLESERWYAALRSGQPLCVGWFDLDGLKSRNDLEGHAVGDALIKAAALALTRASRRGRDEVFRLHTKGDEFLVLLHGPLDPMRVARTFHEVLRRHGVSASAGFAYSPELRYLPARTELRSLAEARCKRAKRQGGDCVIVEESPVTERSQAGIPIPIEDVVTWPIAVAGPEHVCAQPVQS